MEWVFVVIPKLATCNSVEDIEKFAMKVENERGSLNMEVDGIVFKFEDYAARDPRPAIQHGDHEALSHTSLLCNLKYLR